MRVLADSDLLLEFFANREGHIEATEKLLEMVQSQQIEMYVTDQCLDKLRFYLSKRDDWFGEDSIANIEAMLNILPISQNLIQEARTYPLPDFESAVEIACATAMNLDAIITQNQHNFAGTSSLLIWSVENLQTRLQLDENLQLKCDKENLETLSLTLICKEPKVNVIREACPREISELFIRQFFKELNSYDPHIFYFSGHGLLTKSMRINDFSEIIHRKFDDFDDWITSEPTLFLLRIFYPLLKKDCNRSILSIKYLHKYLLKVLQSQFPKKSVNDFEQLPFNYSSQKLKFLTWEIF